MLPGILINTRILLINILRGLLQTQIYCHKANRFVDTTVHRVRNYIFLYLNSIKLCC
jgi:hypothetical protein